MYYLRFKNNELEEVSLGVEYTLLHHVGEWYEAPEGFDPELNTATIDNNGIVSIVVKEVKTKEEKLIELNGNRLIYNDEFEYNNDNFRDFYLYNLKGVVSNEDIDDKGDVTHIKWYKGDVVAIEEYRTYTRTEKGQMPFEVSTLTKDTEIRFYKKNGEFLTKVLPTKEYNTKERKEKDEKSRTNLLEKTRELTGVFIATQQTMNGTPENILPALNEALQIFNTLNKEVNQYKFERLNQPLITALSNYPQTNFINQEVLNYIISLIDVEFYTSI